MPFTMNRRKSSSTFIKNFAMIVVMAGLSLSACTTERQGRGYIMNHEILDGIMPGLDNVNSVRSSMGRPSMTGTFDPSVWYYVSSATIIKSIFIERPISHLVVAVHFDDSGIVEEVERFGLADTREINPVDDKIPTRGKTLGFFEQIFGNIGRFASAPGGQQPF
jgi:outer membrane protein assembly factor BamE (lipoprotein component of BamABCDE complex)